MIQLDDSVMSSIQHYKLRSAYFTRSVRPSDYMLVSVSTREGLKGFSGSLLLGSFY
jgi:hypothetical protein